ncbi:MAG TPA: NmrA/HSCARG family protein [Chitinophagaceae bacterium]|nr:NmrA/HSCARG family protein [Chitinophagaceae bacterium]
MPAKKIITVFGATGAQGGGLVRAITNDPNSEFAVRAITREPNSDKAKALAALGAEVVYGDLGDAASVHKALEGAYGAFFVTFYWAHFSPEQEKKEAALFAYAAKDAGIKHAIWSTLEDTRELFPIDDNRMPTLMDKYNVPHFDAKGESNKQFIAAGVPTTFLHASFYWDNFIYFGAGPKRGEDGKLALTLPIGDAKMAGIAAEDIGKCVYGIFKRGQEYIGKNIGVAGEHLSGKQMADALSKALEEPVVYNKIPASVYRSFGFPGADDLGNMFQVYDEFEEKMNDLRDVKVSKQLNPELQNFEQWLAQNAKKIPV